MRAHFLPALMAEETAFVKLRATVKAILLTVVQIGQPWMIRLVLAARSLPAGRS